MAEEHILAVARVERECFASPWTADGLRAELVSDTAVFLVALLNGILIGYGGMHFVCGEGYFDNIAVLPEFRRQGIGRAIVQALLDFARQHGGAFVSLEVRESNSGAFALYRMLGFRRVGRRRNFYTKPSEDALILTKRF
jgi:ribosomal-protein-alanine N-acetyltransferase